MDSRKVLIVTNKMATANNIYNFIIKHCRYSSDMKSDTISAGYKLTNVSQGTGTPADITIIVVSNVESERYKAYSYYDRVIIDNVFEYNNDKEIVKTFEKCARNLYDVVDIDLDGIQV